MGGKLDIESPVDKVSYSVSATIKNLQTWKTSDEDTGIAVEVTPRYNDDGTVTCHVLVDNRGTAVKMVVRMKLGSSYSLDVPGEQKANIEVGPTEAIRTVTLMPAPKVRLTVEDPSPASAKAEKPGTAKG